MANETPRNVEEDGPRFYAMNGLDKQIKTDAQKALNSDLLVPIVDEDAGGIIAYARGEDHARTLINALNKNVQTRA